MSTRVLYRRGKKVELEQIDGVNLRWASANHLHGVHEASPGTFETARAVAVGRLVAGETERPDR